MPTPPDPRHAHPLPPSGELWLVRHGESVANAAGIGQGRAEYPLSDRGREQARLTAAHLAAVGPFDAVVTSPQERAARTALAIAEALGLPVLLEPDLVEIDIGVLSGRSWSQLEDTHATELAAYRAAEARAPHPRNRTLIPGWEHPAEVLDRTWRAIARAAHEQPGGRVIVVAHGGVLNAFLTHLLTGDARETPWAHPISNCAVTQLQLSPTGATAACLTDDSHLEAMASGRTVWDAPKTGASSPP